MQLLPTMLFVRTVEMWTRSRTSQLCVGPLLRKSENPYASLELVDTAEPTQGQTFADRRRAYIRLLGNQYASLSLVDQLEEETPAVLQKATGSRRACSKAEFRATCRKIFLGYIPALENGKLREHHRDFITRNESRSPDVRYRLLVELQKYDLSSHPGLRAQFNRERDIWTEEKLRKIEKDTEKS